MKALVASLYIEQGATWSQGLIVSTVSTGQVTNLIGYSAECEIRTFSIDSGGKLIIAPTVTFDPDPTTGHLTISLTASQTKLLRAPGADYSATSVYSYDLFLTSSNGTESRILNGSVYVSPRITN